jgi:hypothetical protein
MVNTTVCKLYGNPSSDFILSVKQYDVLACKKCDLFYINPYPEESSAHSKVKEYSHNDLVIVDAKKPELYKPLSLFIKMQSARNHINKKIVCFIAAVLGSKNARLKKERFEEFKQTYLNVSGQKFASVDDSKLI